MNPVAGGGVVMEETERPVQFLEPSPSTPYGGYRAMIRGRDVVKLMRVIGYKHKAELPWEASRPLTNRLRSEFDPIENDNVGRSADFDPLILARPSYWERTRPALETRYVEEPVQELGR